MGVWKSVEYVEVTITAATEPVTVALTKEQDETQCVPFFSVRSTGQLTDQHQDRMGEVEIIDDGGTPSVRVSASARADNQASVFQIFVVEWAASITVQQVDVSTLTDTTPSVNVSISDVGDQTTAFLIYSYQYTNPPTSDDDWNDIAVQVRFNGAATDSVTLSRRASGGAANGTLYVVECNSGEFVVDHREIDITTASATSGNDTLASTVTPADTFILHTYESSENADDLRDGAWVAELTDGDTVTVRRAVAGTPSATSTHSIAVVECQDNEWDVQRVTALTLSSTSVTSDFGTAVTTARSFINQLDHSGHPFSVGRGDSTTGGDIDNVQVAADFNATPSTDTARFRKRVATTTNEVISYEVIQFKPEPQGLGGSVSNSFSRTALQVARGVVGVSMALSVSAAADVHRTHYVSPAFAHSYSIAQITAEGGGATVQTEGTSYSLSFSTATLAVLRAVEGTSASHSVSTGQAEAIRSVQGTSYSASVSNTALEALRAVEGQSSAYSSGTAGLATLRAIEGTSASISISEGTVFTEAIAPVQGTSASVGVSRAELEVLRAVEGTSPGHSSSTGEIEVLRDVVGISVSSSLSTGIVSTGTPVQVEGASSSHSLSTTALTVLRDVRGTSAALSLGTTEAETLRAVAGTSASVSVSTGTVSLPGATVAVQGTSASHSISSATDVHRTHYVSPAFAHSFSTAQLGVGKVALGVGAAYSYSTGQLQVLRAVEGTSSGVSVSESQISTLVAPAIVGVSSGYSSSTAQLQVLRSLAGSGFGYGVSSTTLQSWGSITGLSSSYSSSTVEIYKYHHLSLCFNHSYSTAQIQLAGFPGVTGASSSHSSSTAQLTVLRAIAGQSVSTSSGTAAVETLRAVAGQSVSTSLSRAAATVAAVADVQGASVSTSFSSAVLGRGRAIVGSSGSHSSGVATLFVRRAVGSQSYAHSYSTGTVFIGPVPLSGVGVGVSYSTAQVQRQGAVTGTSHAHSFSTAQVKAAGLKGAGYAHSLSRAEIWLFERPCTPRPDPSTPTYSCDDSASPPSYTEPDDPAGAPCTPRYRE